MTDLRDKIADEIAGHPIGSGYYQTTISIYEAQEMSDNILALLTGEEARAPTLPSCAEP